MGADVTATEKRSAEELEALLRDDIVRAWHSSPKAGPRTCVVAGYFDHVKELLRVDAPSRPGQLGFLIINRLDLLSALQRTKQDELIKTFRYCGPGVIPVYLCAGTHTAMVYLHRAPEDAATVGRGGDA